MKKLLLAITALLLLNVGVMAQESKTKKEQPAQQKREGQQDITECCMMKKGKVVHFKDGKEMPVTTEMDMGGMKVMPDGTCKMKDGKTMKLKEGECCDSHGVLHKNCRKLMKRNPASGKG